MRTSKTRLLSWAIGSTLLAGFVAYPLTSHYAIAADEGHNPRIHHAIDALREAKHELEESHHDFRGEKKDALEAIDKALDKLDKIKDYDR